MTNKKPIIRKPMTGKRKALPSKVLLEKIKRDQSDAISNRTLLVSQAQTIAEEASSQASTILDEAEAKAKAIADQVADIDVCIDLFDGMLDRAGTGFTAKPLPHTNIIEIARGRIENA